MEPEFQHMLVRVLVFGLLIMIGGTVALFFAFRSFEKPTGPRGFLWLMGIAFAILVISAVLWRLSYGPE
jgi:hypothetical protein